MCYNTRMKKQYNKRRFPNKRRRSRLGGKKGGSFFKHLFAGIGIIILAAVLAVAVMFVLEVAFKINTPLPPDGIFGKLASAMNLEMVTSPTPEPTPEPTEEPGPVDPFNGEITENELVFPAEMNYPFLADPYCFKGSIICAVGKQFDRTVKLYKLAEYGIDSKTVHELPIDAMNDHLFFPVFNEKWLVYFDAHYSVGGGYICAVDRTNPDAQPVIVKQVYIGQPKIRLSGDRITWIERTGSDRDKIFVCDLSTMETAVIQFFDRSDYGTSMPYFFGDLVLWAAPGTGDASVIKYINIETGATGEFSPGTYVHDPEYNGEYYAWLNAPHSPEAALYTANTASDPMLVAEGVTEFAISEKFIAYGLDEAVYVYVFETGSSYRITPEREDALFLGVSDGAVFWMDVTSRERDIIKFTVPPL